jgi:hypothetical protein
MAIDLSALFRRAGRAAAENSPVILTALAVTGTLSTAYLVASATVKAVRMVDSEQESRVQEHSRGEREAEDVELSTAEKFDLTWKCYIPAACSAALTVATIVGVKTAGDRSAATMAMAYKASEKAYKEYRESTLQKVGKTKEQAIHEDAMQKMADKHPYEKTQVIYTGKGGTLIFDPWNGRYFDHDPERIRQIVNEFNKQVIHDGSATLNDFWGLLEVDKTFGSENVGWDTDELMEIREVYHTVNGNPCLILDFLTRPKTLYGVYR